MKWVVFLAWYPEIDKVIRSTDYKPLYIIDKKLGKSRFEKEVDECRNSKSEYIIVDDLNNLNCVYSLASLLMYDKHDYIDIISVNERTQLAGAILIYNLIGDSDRANLLFITRDKRMMKEKLAGVVQTASYKSLQYSTFPLEKSSSEIQWPKVLKPVNGEGSLGTELIKDNDSYNLLVDNLNECFYNQVIEDYNEGDEHNVDCIVRDGKIIYLFIGRYIVPRLKGYYNKTNKVTLYLPYDHYSDLYAKVEFVFNNILKTIGLRNGISHAECFIKNDKLVLGEIASRHAGGAMSDCVKHLVGESLLELGLRARLGCISLSPAQRHPYKDFIGFIDLRPEEAGTIVELSTPEELKSVPGVLEVIYRLKIGDRVGNYERNNWCVMVVVKQKTEKEFYTTLDVLKHKFRCAVTNT